MHVHTCSPFTLLFNCFHSLGLTFFCPTPQYSPTLLSFRLNKCNLAGKRLRIQMLSLSHSLILHYPPCKPFFLSLLTHCFYHESWEVLFFSCQHTLLFRELVIAHNSDNSVVLILERLWKRKQVIQSYAKRAAVRQARLSSLLPLITRMKCFMHFTKMLLYVFKLADTESKIHIT